MIDAIEPGQRADLLQFALSPWCGREAPGANPGQMASSAARGSDPVAVAEGDDDRGVFAGATAQGMGGVGAKAQSDALCRSKSGGAEAVARKKIGPSHPGQGRADLPAGGDG